MQTVDEQFAARKIVTEAVGFWYGKNKGFAPRVFDCFDQKM